ncbi:MAG: hypothetical protein WA003_05580 [Desulfuromonadaceae bacterium]
MTKRKDSLVSDTRQMGLFDLLQRERDERVSVQPGRLNISARLNAAIKQAIRQAPKSRETMADEMTELLGIEITVGMVNNWTAISHPHRMPAEYIPAFCIVTNSNDSITILNEATGVFTVNGADALRADIRKEEEALKARQREIRKKVALLEALEAKQ